jgi:hypothetical protein
MKTLKTLYGLVIGLSILLGFFFGPEHALFAWHKIPSWDAIFGVLGALGLLAAGKGAGAITFRGEDFYD